MIHQQTLEFRTRGRGTQEVTAELQRGGLTGLLREGGFPIRFKSGLPLHRRIDYPIRCLLSWNPGRRAPGAGLASPDAEDQRKA